MTNMKPYRCHFPGCEFSSKRPGWRDRHETIQHGIKHGVLKGSAPPLAAPLPPVPEAPPVLIDKSQIVRAIETLEAQRAVLLEALVIRHEIRATHERQGSMTITPMDTAWIIIETKGVKYNVTASDGGLRISHPDNARLFVVQPASPVVIINVH